MVALSGRDALINLAGMNEGLALYVPDTVKRSKVTNMNKTCPYAQEEWLTVHQKGQT